MNLKQWESVIQEIVTELNQELSEYRKVRIIRSWRSKLEYSNTPLPLHLIDEIVREIRRRLTAK